MSSGEPWEATTSGHSSDPCSYMQVTVRLERTEFTEEYVLFLAPEESARSYVTKLQTMAFELPFSTPETTWDV